LVSIGAGGLAAALLAHSAQTASAQEATPSPAGGLPPGVGIIPVSTLAVSDMPPGTVNVTIYRFTLEPGASSPVSTFPFPSIIVVETGTLICPGGAPRHFVGADGTAREVGEEEVPLNPGDALYIPANVPDGGRNDGTEQLVALVVDLVPAEEMATPTA
jgi:hypothetical protein